MYNYRWFKQQPAVLLLGVILLSACYDDPTLPKPGVNGPRVTYSTTPGGGTLPPLHSNSIKYRDAGKKPGIGREGSATLTARGLLAKNGETLLEITTGALDEGSAPGNLDKIQIKTMDPNGSLMSVVNYNKLKNGGYASYGILNLVPGSQVQVQSNVSGVDPTRTDVVTVLESVKLRPDLAVTRLDAPARAMPRVPVNIGATIQELNGDVGARTNCVLFVDGVATDRADGVWVDALSTVSCAFLHSFETTGTKRLRVALETVRPDDWDTGNNFADATIDVAAANDFHWWASAVDLTFEYLNRGDWSWSYGPDAQGLTGASHDTYSYQEAGRYQAGAQSGWMPLEITFPLERMEFSQESNGALLLSTSFDNVPADWTYTYSDPYYAERQACAVRVAQLQLTDRGEYWHVYAQVCAGASGPIGEESPWTDFHQQRWAGEVTYFSRNSGEQWFRNAAGSCTSCYSWNYTFAGTLTAGLPLPTLGPDYGMRFQLSSAGRTFAATSVVPLSPLNQSYSEPYTCYDWASGYYRGRQCREYRNTQQGVYGSAFGSPGTP